MASSMGKRFLSLLILIPLGIFLIYFDIWNGLLFFIVLLLIQLVIIYEITIMAEKRKYRFHIWPTSIAVTLSTLGFYLFGLGMISLAYFVMVELILGFLYVVAIMAIESTGSQFDTSFEVMGISLLSFVLVGYLLPFVGLLKLMDQSGWLVGAALAFAWLSDSGGLFIGKAFGKTPIKNISSPKKTVEGYAGAIGFALITAVVLYFLQTALAMSSIFSLLQWLLIGLVVALAAILGDLAESTIKRWARVKDAGALFPGHGGLFDIFDSVILAAPAFYILIQILS